MPCFADLDRQEINCGAVGDDDFAEHLGFENVFAAARHARRSLTGAYHEHWKGAPVFASVRCQDNDMP